jgi:hypothetical protein
VTPPPRARSISRRIVHWRITSALRGTKRFYNRAITVRASHASERVGESEGRSLSDRQ